MKINQKVHPYLQFSKFIELECTGTASEFAKKIGVCRATVFNMIEECKLQEVQIDYNDRKESYYYSGTKRLNVSTPIKIVDSEQ